MTEAWHRKNVLFDGKGEMIEKEWKEIRTNPLQVFSNTLRGRFLYLRFALKYSVEFSISDNWSIFNDIGGVGDVLSSYPYESYMRHPMGRMKKMCPFIL
jgi:hypothetical protein